MPKSAWCKMVFFFCLCGTPAKRTNWQHCYQMSTVDLFFFCVENVEIHFRMPLKVCFVPKCLNTNENSNKLFISIPSDPKTRAKWFSAVNIPILGRKDLFCCEDHFDMERDAKNWMHFKLMGSRLFMKDDVFPHKYLEDSKSPSESSQFPTLARKRKMEMSKSLLVEKISEASRAQEIKMDYFPVFFQLKEIELPGELITIPLENEIVQSTASHFVPVSKENKKVQVQIKPNMKDVSTNTNVLTRSVSTTTVSQKNCLKSFQKPVP